MASQFSVDVTLLGEWVSQDEFGAIQPEISKAYDALKNKSGKGADFLGWWNPKDLANESLIADIKATANEIRDKYNMMIVIGIGGSYLGARAVIDALSSPFRSYDKSSLQIIYAGHHLSQDYHADLLKLIDNYDVCLNVISKSGTTTEPAVAFRLFKDALYKKYGESDARKRIFATTDQAKGALKKLATEEGYKCYVIPDDVGGRYSVLTPVGLLPIAVAGFDISELFSGAIGMYNACLSPDLGKSPTSLYAAARSMLYRKGKKVEMLVSYLPQLVMVHEWWKQLYGESEGKENKGIFPASCSFTSDLHSMGQYIQEGERHLFETVLEVKSEKQAIKIIKNQDDLDGLNFLEGKNLHEINSTALKGVVLAHHEGKVPNIILGIPSLSTYTIGELVYFFEQACGISGYVLGINPFDQPGVETYKKNMFALLNKPGYEAQNKALQASLSAGFGKHEVRI